MHDSSAGTYFFNDKTDKWPRKKDKKNHHHCKYDQIWSQETSKLITIQVSHLNIVGTPHPHFCRGELSLQPNFQKGGGGGVDRASTFRGGFLEKSGWFFSEALPFSHKNKLKSEIFNDKKSLLAKIFFSAITKNSNWDILVKNLVTLKDWWYKDEKLGFTERSDF